MRTDQPVQSIAGTHCDPFIGSCVIDRGAVAFRVDCSQAGKEGSYLLFWDGAQIFKVADSGTPMPGLGGATLMFDELGEEQRMVSLVGGAQPRVLFRASQGASNEFALYEWRPGMGITMFPRNESEFKGYVHGSMAGNGAALIWSRPNIGPGALPELHLVDALSETHTVLMGGDTLGDKATEADFVRNPPPLFNGNRVVAEISTKPESEGGWWSLESGEARRIWKYGSQVQSQSDPSLHYWRMDIQDISPPHAASQSVVGIGSGPWIEGREPVALLYSPSLGAPFKIIHETGLPVADRPGFKMVGFNRAEVIGDSVIFDAFAVDGNGNALTGVFEWSETGARTLVDSGDFGGYPFVRLLGRDDYGSGILIGVIVHPSPDIFNLDGAYETLYLMSRKSSLPLADWLVQELGDLGEGESITGIQADPDGDGVPNLLEYVLGGDPAEKDGASTLPNVQVGDGGVRVEYTLRSGLPQEISVVTEVYDSDAEIWIPVAGMAEENVVPSEQSGFDKVTIRPHTSFDDGLYRVRVDHSNP